MLNEQNLIMKLRALPPEKVAEVEDFIDFLSARDNDRRLSQAVTKSSEPLLAKIWDNPDDAEYDKL